MNNKCFFVVSRYNEDISWLDEYDNDYLIYNKGSDDINGYNHINVSNVGANQYDICRYIYDNYHNLPQTIAFIQGDPFDHCNKEVFDSLIDKNWFSSLESYEHVKENRVHKKCKFIDYGYMEKNNSWYIKAHNKHLKKNGFTRFCAYYSFDEFMNSLFVDYRSINLIRFAPGSQYLVNKERCLQYKRSFWWHLMNIFPKDEGINGGTEAHIVERALWLIFNGFFKPHDKFEEMDN